MRHAARCVGRAFCAEGGAWPVDSRRMLPGRGARPVCRPLQVERTSERDTPSTQGCRRAGCSWPMTPGSTRRSTSRLRPWSSMRRAVARRFVGMRRHHAGPAPKSHRRPRRMTTGAAFSRPGHIINRDRVGIPIARAAYFPGMIRSDVCGDASWPPSKPSTPAPPSAGTAGEPCSRRLELPVGKTSAMR